MVCLIFLEEERVGVGLGIFRAGEGLGVIWVIFFDGRKAGL